MADAPLAGDDGDKPVAADALLGHLVFGFLQRVLVRLNNLGQRQGLLFPKKDVKQKNFFDYFDGEGRIYVLSPGTGASEMAMEQNWVRRRTSDHAGITTFDLAPGAADAILHRFLTVVVGLRARAEATGKQ